MPAKRFPLVGEGSVRAAPVLALPAVLTDLGIDPWAVIDEAGVDRALFDDPERVASFTDVGHLMALAAQRSGCPHIGLLVGRRGGLHVLGRLGELLSHAAELGSALNNLILYLHLHDRGSVPALWVTGDQTMLIYSVYKADVPGIEQVYDTALVIACRIIQELAGPDWRPTEIRLSRSRPADGRPYREHFKAPLTFDAEQSAVVFDSGWLEHRLGGADCLMHARILRELEDIEAQGGGDLVEQLRRLLRRLLISGADQRQTSLAQTARLFALHRRTLNRRLRTRGTSFRELLDEARFDIARQLLRDTPMSVSEVAAALDYSDSTAFTHAFRRWADTSPARWRQTMKVDGTHPNRSSLNG